MLHWHLPLWSGTFFHEMFHLNLPVAEKMLRPVLVYMFLVLLLRVFGKRELAQLNPFDLVVLLSLSNTVQNAIIGDDTSVLGGLIGAFTLCGVNYLVVRFLFRHRKLDQLLEGKPTVLIENGRLRKQAMTRELITRSELLSVARRQGFESLDEVDRCMLEPGGTFCIQGKEPRGLERHHVEMSQRMEQLTRQVDELRRLIEERVPPAPAAADAVATQRMNT